MDGLRGLAVLLVLFFHVGFTGFSGGFIGVDIFFVISGFLITQQIRDDVQDGTFSYVRFYERRARRILPALFFTFLVSLIAAYYLLAPNHMTLFGGSLFHALSAISNIFFWVEDDYFSPGAEFKPLLHTWSLSVEEQFYLIWPAMMLLILTRTGKNFPPYYILFVGIVSLIIGEMKLKEDAAAVFYLTQYRVMEFALGAALVWFAPHQPRNRLFLEPVALMGLVLIFYSAVFFTRGTAFPGFNSMIPCLGAALLIYGGKAGFSGRLLNNPLMVRVGVISYSLYLIHWPVYVYYSYQKQQHLSNVDIFAVIVVSLVAAFFMHRYIETPFRKSTPQAGPHVEYSDRKFLSASAFGLTFAMLFFLLSIPAANIWKTNGWKWRYDMVLLTQDEVDRFEHWRRSERELANEVEFDGYRIPVVIEGDSQADDIYIALKNDPRIQLKKLGESYSPNDVKTARAYIFSSLKLDTLGQEDLRKIFADIRKMNNDIDIFLFGPKPHLSDINLTLINGSELNLPPNFDKDKNAVVNEYLNHAKKNLDHEINFLKVVSDNLGATFVDVHQIYCNGKCIFYGSNKFAYIDTVHWTKFGMEIFVSNFRNTKEYTLLTTGVARPSAHSSESGPGMLLTRRDQ